MDDRRHEVKAEEVVKILKENGKVVTLEQAKQILAFMNEFAKLSLEGNVTVNDSFN